METNQQRRMYDPYPTEPAALSDILDTGLRVFRLGLGGLLCLVGLFFSIQIFFTVYEYVTEPESLQAILEVWDGPVAGPLAESPAAAAETATSIPGNSSEPVQEADVPPAAGPEAPPAATETPEALPQGEGWISDTVSRAVDELAEGRLARPIGGLVVVLFVGVLVQIALGFIRIGAGLLNSGRVASR